MFGGVSAQFLPGNRLRRGSEKARRNYFEITHQQIGTGAEEFDEFLGPYNDDLIELADELYC